MIFFRDSPQIILSAKKCLGSTKLFSWLKFFLVLVLAGYSANASIGYHAKGRIHSMAVNLIIMRVVVLESF